MNFDHVFWTQRRTTHGCHLGGTSPVEDGWEIGDGVPREDGFPNNVTLQMKSDFPRDTLTPDCLNSITCHTIISERLRDYLRSRDFDNLEFLPVTILNHKGSPVASPYAIVHPVHPVDCLDIQACNVTWEPMDDSLISNLSSFELDSSKVDDVPPIMRIAGLSYHVAVHRSIAKELDDEGFTGNGWTEPNDLVGKDLVCALRAISIQP